jgi:hypothetical protein
VLRASREPGAEAHAHILAIIEAAAHDAAGRAK